MLVSLKTYLSYTVHMKSHFFTVLCFVLYHAVLILQCSFAVLCACSFIDHSYFSRLICFPEQLPSLLNHDRALLKIRVGDVFIRFEKSLHLSLSSDHRLCWRNKPEGLFVWHLAFLMWSAGLTPEPYEICDDFFVLSTTIAIITVLNLFSVVTPKQSPSTQTSIVQCHLYGSSSLSSIPFKVNWMGQPRFVAESGRSQTCSYTVLFVFWFGERVSLCSSDWLMAYSVLKVMPFLLLVPPEFWG